MVDLDTAANPGHVQKKQTEQLVLREKRIEWICMVVRESTRYAGAIVAIKPAALRAL